MFVNMFWIYVLFIEVVINYDRWEVFVDDELS